MKIENHFIPEITIEAFAAEHGLTMEVRERECYAGHPERYYAQFQNSEVKSSIFLRSAYGNGSTPNSAIRAYAEEISFKLLVIRGNSPQERRIPVPRLTFAGFDRPPGVPVIPWPL